MIASTKKILLEVSGGEAEVKEWITGGEAEQIQSVLYSGIEVKPAMGSRSVDFGKFDPSLIEKQAHKELEIFLVSLNGKTENLLTEVLALPEADYQAIKDAIASLRAGKKKEELGQ